MTERQTPGSPNIDPQGVLVLISEGLSAVSIVVPMNRGAPRRFVTLEGDGERLFLRDRDDSLFVINCDPSVAEAAARCETVVVREVDLGSQEENEYPVEPVGLGNAALRMP